MRYRVSRFWRNIRASPLQGNPRKDVISILNEEQFKLFEQLPPEDQEHSYQVMNTIRAYGQDNHDLLAAALLHDIGKLRAETTVWERSIVVLVKKLFPGFARRLGQGEPRGWKRAFVVKYQHQDWGAEAAKLAGSSEGTIVLIRRHHDYSAGEGTEEAHLLKVLQKADSIN